MANIQYYDVILKPLVTEKSMSGMSEMKYTFLVHPDANKSMIKDAVEKMFGVEVESVNTIIMKRKPKRLGASEGYTTEWKKAIVQLKSTSKTIEFFDGLN